MIKNFGKNFAKNYRIPTITFSKVFLHNIPPVPTSYCSCMLARCISPFEGGRGDVTPKPPTCPYIILFVYGCPSHRPLCRGAGGCFLPSLPPVPTSYCSCMFVRRISPFEGSPRASAAEYVLGGMFPPISPPKNFLSLTPDFQPLNYFPQKNLKKSCQKICRIKKTPYLCTRK